MATIIPSGPAYAIPRCLNVSCQSGAEQIVLPRRNHLGTFEDRPNPTAGVWPIKCLCQICGQVSEVSADMIRPVIVEKAGLSRLFRYDFSNGQLDPLVRLTIYTKEKNPSQINLEDSQQAIDRILTPFGLWKDAYGTPKKVGIDWM